jgi:4,5-DOPA dioxygenase extradiol
MWAARFDQEIATALEQHDFDQLSRAITTDHGRLSHPSPDHYLPLLYAAGAANDNDAVSFPVNGWDLGSLSMRSFQFGK